MALVAGGARLDFGLGTRRNDWVGTNTLGGLCTVTERG